MAGYKRLVEQDSADIILGIAPTSGITYSDTYFLGLYLSDPTNTTTGGEVTAASYARQSMTLVRSADGSVNPILTNTNTVTFPQALEDWGTVVAFAPSDALTLGEQIMYGSLAASKDIVTGEQMIIGIGEFVQTID